jgi:hypothetical protein
MKLNIHKPKHKKKQNMGIFSSLLGNAGADPRELIKRAGQL